jgi:hypothetical protein
MIGKFQVHLLTTVGIAMETMESTDVSCTKTKEEMGGMGKEEVWIWHWWLLF